MGNLPGHILHAIGTLMFGPVGLVLTAVISGAICFVVGRTWEA